MRIRLCHACQCIFFRMTVAIAALGFVALWLSDASGQEMRTWSDKSGKFKIQAKLIEASGDRVVLEREDGAQVTIPLSKLSDADQKAATEMGSSSETPFQAVQRAKKSKAVDDEEEEAVPAKAAKKKKSRSSGESQNSTGKSFGSTETTTKTVGNFGGPKSEDVAPEGGVLVGFELGLGKFGPNPIIIAIRPIFQTADGEELLGKEHGTVAGKMVRVKAKKGYAVGAVKVVQLGALLGGLTVTFMKQAKDELDPEDSYESKPVGGNLGMEQKLSGGGVPVLGIVAYEGRAGHEYKKACTGVALVLSGPSAAPDTPPGLGPNAGPPPAPANVSSPFSPKNGKFTITMPAGQTSFQGGQTLNIRGVHASVDLSLRVSDGVSFIAQSIGVSGPAMRLMSPAECSKAVRDALAGQSKGTVSEEREIKQGPRQGKELRIDGNGKFSRAQLFVQGGCVLCAIVMGSTKEVLSSQKAEDFFASFKITDAH